MYTCSCSCTRTAPAPAGSGWARAGLGPVGWRGSPREEVWAGQGWRLPSTEHTHASRAWQASLASKVLRNLIGPGSLRESVFLPWQQITYQVLLAAQDAAC